MNPIGGELSLINLNNLECRSGNRKYSSWPKSVTQSTSKKQMMLIFPPGTAQNSERPENNITQHEVNISEPEINFLNFSGVNDEADAGTRKKKKSLSTNDLPDLSRKIEIKKENIRRMESSLLDAIENETEGLFRVSGTFKTIDDAEKNFEELELSDDFLCKYHNTACLFKRLLKNQNIFTSKNFCSLKKKVHNTINSPSKDRDLNTVFNNFKVDLSFKHKNEFNNNFEAMKNWLLSEKTKSVEQQNERNKEFKYKTLEIFISLLENRDEIIAKARKFHDKKLPNIDGGLTKSCFKIMQEAFSKAPDTSSQSTGLQIPTENQRLSKFEVAKLFSLSVFDLDCSVKAKNIQEEFKLNQQYATAILLLIFSCPSDSPFIPESSNESTSKPRSSVRRSLSRTLRRKLERTLTAE